MATKKKAAKKAVAKKNESNAKPRDPRDVYGTAEYWKWRYETETRMRLRQGERRILAMALEGRLLSLAKSRDSALCDSARLAFGQGFTETKELANRIHYSNFHPDDMPQEVVWDATPPVQPLPAGEFDYAMGTGFSQSKG